LPKCNRLNVVVGLGGREELLALLMVKESDEEAVAPVESFTVNAAICVPAVVGAPLIMPVLLMESPAGRLPADHVYGEVPPVAANVAEYAVPTVPVGRVPVEITSGAGAGGGVEELEDAPLNATISIA
jgi:hypothetical protein